MSGTKRVSPSGSWSDESGFTPVLTFSLLDLKFFFNMERNTRKIKTLGLKNKYLYKSIIVVKNQNGSVHLMWHILDIYWGLFKLDSLLLLKP